MSFHVLFFCLVHEQSASRLVSQIDQLQKALAEKDKEIKGLQSTVQQMSYRLEKCERNITMEIQNYVTLKSEVDKVSSKESCFRWCASFQKIQQFMQYSEPFYTPVLPFCFQIGAFWSNRVLQIFLYRCRGTNDKSCGSINTDLPGYSFELYVIDLDDNIESKEAAFNEQNFNFNIYTGDFRSEGNGWSDFMSPSNWGKWLINNHIRIFCKIKKLF